MLPRLCRLAPARAKGFINPEQRGAAAASCSRAHPHRAAWGGRIRFPALRSLSPSFLPLGASLFLAVT